MVSVAVGAVAAVLVIILPALVVAFAVILATAAAIGLGAEPLVVKLLLPLVLTPSRLS